MDGLVIVYMSGSWIDLNWKLPYVGLTLFDILFAIVAFVVGYILVVLFVRIFRRSLMKTGLPHLLTEFLSRFLKALLIVILILAILPILHIDVSSIVLGLSAVIGLILGFGMQDTMTNIFAGFWIAMLKPFEIGDYIEVAGREGSLKSVGVMSTVLLTPDNKYIMIPNKLVWGATIVNYTKMPTRRVSVDVGVSYESDLDKAVKVLMNIMQKDRRVLKDPEPAVIVTELADSSINLQMRAWVKTENYWDVKNDLTKEVTKRLPEEGIEIPYPKMDVFLKKE